MMNLATRWNRRIEAVRPRPRPCSGNSMTRSVVALCLLWTSGVLAPVGAASPRPVNALRAAPPSVNLRGPDSGQQLVVDGLCAGAEPADMTLEASYESSNPGVASVDPRGWVTAKGEGTGTIRVRVGPLSTNVRLTVRDFGTGGAINFGNQVVPIFTKL